MFWRGLRDVVSVSAHAIAYDFCDWLGPTRAGMFQLFKDENSGAFAHHKSVAVTVPWAAGFFGLVIARGKRTHRGETTNTERGDCRFSAAGNHHIGIAVLNNAKRIADGMRTRSTCGGSGFVGPFRAKTHGDVSGREVHDGRRNKKRRNLARTTFH